ncbi:hypothetical protein OG394_21770 [Kribbella sp. NBC_01245]|uniref:hypothetical protein n=1 Tax=Kribbella sp. NBC_01245 TaxID=2903578 RepID=UPI002E2D88DF|nr:hypothetical protein [Kribbella sp. NBC_01245]
MIRTAAVLCWFNAIGFGVFTIPAIARVQAGKDLPIVFGFPAYGQGPFENHGIKSTVPLLAGFLAVCLVEAAAGWLLWGNHRTGAILALAILPAGAIYWWGFALPIPPLVAVARTALLLAAWPKLD